ncbi:FAD-dependent oxidoreductase [Haloarchaeobius iranensis]|uniref:Pyridine nucleotide-disulphide oxidoreductase n=1 Tax=Haloarchaeobius iranensis TaxID=996166 RepID=A0A1G9YI06_9EURY|nr:FAD-dependent oxidoreductase [Haloarchaeobius iranensis]SDN08552.1 Pyridine nucleotide-disulphide oxidoreductase [Haloarchaeobius iranensis]
MTGDESNDGGEPLPRHDVVVVGGGPAGASAAVFTARYGLDTVVFDRGAAALDRCAFLSNYPGFPAGIDVGTFQALLADHVETAGARRVEDSVVAVDRPADGERDAAAVAAAADEARFVVETADDRRVLTDYVLAAAWYDGSYLEPLDDGKMFELHEHHGEERERFDPDYPDHDGRTPVDGLYVASPADARSAQAVVAAGNGAHVARALLADHRSAAGYPEGVTARYDWLRQASEFTGEWADRDRWREWFETEAGDHDLDDERFADLRESYLDRAFGTKTDEDEVERRTEAAQHRLLEHLDDEHIRSYLAAQDASAADD